jgi:CRISPR-associated endonuclease Cas2
MTDTRRYVVAYDVTSNRLRRRIRTICRAYGGRCQYSLFEMYLTEHERAELITKIGDTLSGRDEFASVKIYSVGPATHDTTLGDDLATEPENVV